MDALNQAFPVLIAFLAGFTFLYRTWSRPSIWSKSVSVEKTSGFHISPPLIEDDTRVVVKETDFPDDWFVGKAVFELERRAIFSKTWVCLSHTLRFTKPGDYQSLEVAGFPIILILGKDKIVRAFHNVCRHRAYTVTNKECGSSAVLRCRYHGWSYNSSGQLIKAPHFDSVSGFDKSQNGLFSIQTFTSESGFVFVNLESGVAASLPETGALDEFARRNRLKAQSKWVTGQTIEGRFNWKMAVSSKCFRSTIEPRNEKTSLPLAERLFSYFQNQPETFSFFPITFIYTIRGSANWYSLTFSPVSEQKTLVRYDFYSHKSTSIKKSQATSKGLVELLENEISLLDVEYQTVNELKDCASIVLEYASGDADMQQGILEVLKAHAKLEKAQGTEIFAAMSQPRKNAKYEAAEQLCRDLACPDDAGHKSLAW